MFSSAMFEDDSLVPEARPETPLQMVPHAENVFIDKCTEYLDPRYLFCCVIHVIVLIWIGNIMEQTRGCLHVGAKKLNES